MVRQVKYYCDSCRQEIEFNKKEYLKHFKKFHPKKINNKLVYLNGYVTIKNDKV